MIPKLIHYCWFGGNPLDEKSNHCLKSWKRFFPDYTIICWNEDNFDVDQVSFMADAYHQKKWAFVSDVARLIVIYQNGGIYFDTDVEVLASYDDILAESQEGFMGLEKTGFVATGLGFAAEKGNSFLLELIKEYKRISFSDYANTLDKIACPIIMTELMQRHGYINENRFQSFRGFNIYPTSYFSPLDYDTGVVDIKEETHSIHWGNASWNNEHSRQMRSIMQFCNRTFGKEYGEKIFGVYSSIKREGLVNYVRRHL